MSRSFTRLLLALAVLISGEVGAIGLGDIKLDSALNEPLRAEIQLLSAGAEELDGLTVALASEETFARYGIDRPFFLQDVEFNTQNGVVQLRSRAPITEPFLTFLVEATWPSGRLLREYTVLLDPPTFAPPAIQQAPAVSAPQRSRASDSGQIQRQAPAQPSSTSSQSSQPAAAQAARTASEPKPQPARDDTPYDTVAGGDLVIGQGDTLWGVAARMRPDSRLSMNQTMLAIYEANPDAFGGNINVLKAGSTLRIPSADEVFRISRGDAFSEVQRHNTAWDSGGTSSAAIESTTRPSLTLVPPDEEPADSPYDDSASYEPMSREDEIADRIATLESADVPDQQSLIEVRDNELAELRQELANIRGEVYEPPVDETVVDEEFMVDETNVDETMVDEELIDEGDAETNIDNMFPDQEEMDAAAVDDAVTEDSSTVVRTSRSDDKGIVDQVLGFFNSLVGYIVLGSLVLVAGLLVWFMRRGGDDEGDDSGPWEPLDADDLPTDSMSATESMKAPTPDEAMLVVEQDSGVHPMLDDTVEAQAADVGEDSSGSFGSLEDTFSSETAVNLDQTDPVAEADFHMAYGLYDQAADLINGALETDPTDKGLMSKLCEIYFVWGNRESFVDAATRLKSAVGDSASGEWDKIVIMGQQIAADHDLFAGAELAGSPEAVDLAFDDDSADATGALDMDFGTPGDSDSEIVDLGSDEQTQEGVDFLFDDAGDSSSVDLDLEATAESPTIESPASDATAEMPEIETTAESPTIEDQFAVFGDGTAELPSLDASLGDAISASGQDAEATAEINLDDLDLDIDGLAETELASLDDLDETGQNAVLDDLADVTGKNPEVDPDDTGVRQGLEANDYIDPDATGEMRLAPDETGKNPLVDAESEHETTDVDLDESLLDATGLTQVLSDDLAVDTGTDLNKNLADDEATLLAPMDEDGDDFDFAKTEALPPEVFTGNSNLDDTSASQTIASTDVDLDLDDLTAALQSSDVGDTVEQVRDDETVEQPRPSVSDETSSLPTMELAPGEMSDDLHEARTMTEVGTKLDLARAYVDMGDPAGARSILEEVLDEGDDGQKQQAQQLLDSLPS